MHGISKVLCRIWATSHCEDFKLPMFNNSKHASKVKSLDAKFPFAWHYHYFHFSLILVISLLKAMSYCIVCIFFRHFLLSLQLDFGTWINLREIYRPLSRSNLCKISRSHSCLAFVAFFYLFFPFEFEEYRRYATFVARIVKNYVRFLFDLKTRCSHEFRE